MSAETEAALRDAIIAHQRSMWPGQFDEALLCDWVIAEQWLDPNEDDNALSNYGQATPEGQAYHRTIGLLHNALEDRMLRQLERGERD